MMSKAKRYTQNKKATHATKGLLLYIFLIPLFISIIFALFQTDIKAFILNSISFLLFLSVASIAKKGFLQENLYHQNTFTKAPKIPYKMIAGYLLALSTFFTAYFAGGEDFIKSIFLSIISTIGYYLYYGFDPKIDKLENLGDISSDFVLETIKEAKTKLNYIKNDISKIKDSLLYEKLKSAILKSENILQTIQEDPKDIRVARKFLIVYIDGIANVTNSYTALEEKDINPKTKEKLHKLMEDVEKKFDKELQRLKQNNEFDLDVHIDVLQEQIKN